MGNCSVQRDGCEPFKETNKHDFTFKQIIGRGGFGKVILQTHVGLESRKEKGKERICYERNA